MKRKYLGIILMTIIFTLLLSSCGSEQKEVVYVYNWGDYIDMEMINQFEDETGIRVEMDTYDSNEAMYVKLKASPGSYDVAVPSDYMLAKMINEDLVEKISWENVPNKKFLDERFQNTEHDPNGVYIAAYMWGTVGIMYNSRLVTEPVDSWDILWNEKYKGQIFMYDSLRDTIGLSLLRLGYSLNSTDMEELSRAKTQLILQKPLVQTYLCDPIKDKMIGEEGMLAVIYSGDALYGGFENPDIQFVIPKEGSNLFYDGMVIPKGAKNKENAEKFIDFMCRPEVAANNSLYVGYSTANIGALDYLPEELVNNPIYSPSDEELSRCYMYVDLGKFIDEYNDAWNEILTAR